MVKHLPAMQETQVRYLGQEDLLEKEMATTPVFLPGKFHGQRSLVGSIMKICWKFSHLPLNEPVVYKNRVVGMVYSH